MRAVGWHYRASPTIEVDRTHVVAADRLLAAWGCMVKRS